MTEPQLPKFRLHEAFFTSLEFSRMPEIPEPLHLRFSVELKVHSEGLPDALQIDLKLETLEDQPLTMILELVGLFRGSGDQTQLEDDQVSRFINERALFILWPYIVQMTRFVTAQMGISPVNIEVPLQFNFLPEAEGSLLEEADDS